MLSALVPEHNWLPWKFETVPPQFWDDIKHQKQFIDWVATVLNIKKYEDWYNIGSKVCLLGTHS